jgi:hypothetical protein
MSKAEELVRRFRALPPRHQERIASAILPLTGKPETQTEKEATHPKDDTMTDVELCERLRISATTLAKYLQHGPPRRRHRNAGDVRTIRHFTVGGQRRWSRRSVEEFIHGEA